jgi:hypothetical protein
MAIMIIVRHSTPVTQKIFKITSAQAKRLNINEITAEVTLIIVILQFYLGLKDLFSMSFSIAGRVEYYFLLIPKYYLLSLSHEL